MFCELFRFYEKHDILSWIWCDQQPCAADMKRDFDFHQQSKHSSQTLREFAPGEGYGGALLKFCCVLFGV